jgi:DNA-binding ferritin-like protein
MPPAKPDPPIQPDEVSERVREANRLLAQAVDRLKDARDLLDEASQVEDLPEGLAGSFQAYESVVESLRRTLDAVVKTTEDKAELWFSRHSPLNRDLPS